MSTSDTPLLVVSDLYFAYKRRLALSGVSFAVNEGSIHGFVGPNGAGKTTTLKILATLMRPRGGRVRVFGRDLVRDRRRVRRKIGFMPDHLSIYRQMTTFEYLDFFGAAYGMSVAERTRTIKDVLALTDMTARRNDLIKSLSRGMQQRVSLSRVLVHDPELLLLDEPASGLDPRARIELMEIFKELARMGKTIFISSHILSELKDLCDSITIIDRGEIKYSGDMQALLAGDGGTADYILTLAAEHPEAERALARMDGVMSVAAADGNPVFRVRIDTAKASTNDVLAAAIASGAQVVSFTRDVKHLNQAFMDLTEPGVPS
jgi:ABC-2 type transport system ATP-binding protein